jgi:pimeloyl-ACP methyl ester carboxylesterase
VSRLASVSIGRREVVSTSERATAAHAHRVRQTDGQEGGTRISAFDSVPYETYSVVSPDGTTIGYRQLGRGPGLVLVHGSGQSSQNFMGLASVLSDAYTLLIPDRRGRGLSGPFGEAYGLQTECDDLRSIMVQTGARLIFGLSSGAVICLHAALTVPEVSKAALYEPPLPVDGRSPAAWADQYDVEIARGDLGSAMVTALKGTQSSGASRFIPRFALVPLMRLAVARADPSQVTGDRVHPLTLVTTLHYDAQLVRETGRRLEDYHSVAVPVLLLRGSRSPAYLRRSVDVLAALLHRCVVVELPGVGHTAADNSGKPKAVARELRAFFGL